MAWLLMPIIFGLLLGTLFRLPAVLAATAVLVLVGWIAGWSWDAILSGLIALQGAYFAALVLSTAFSSANRRRP